MDPPSGFSWLCLLLFGGFIYFPPQEGHNGAHGYYLSENAQTSNPSSGASLNTEEDNDPQAMGHQNFVSHLKEPVQDNGTYVSSVTGFDEMTEEHRPEQDRDESLTPAARPVQKYENMSSGNQHPFGVLLKEHTPETVVEGISFPSIRDFKRFIDTMKSSFLTPGSDLSRYFQTARETMINEYTSGAQTAEGESSMSNSTKEESVNDDNSENEVWSELVLEKSEPDANYQTESLSLDPVDHTASLISHNDIQDSVPDSALYYNSAATEEDDFGNYGSLVDGGISGENHNIFASVPDEQHEDLESTRYIFPEQKPAGDYLSGHDSPQDSLSKDRSHYSSWKSSIKPLTSEKIIQQPKYPSHNEDVGSQPSGDLKKGNQGATVADLLYPQEPPSLTSFGKSIFDAPRPQIYVPLNASKFRKSSDQLGWAYEPTLGEKLKDINYTQTILPRSADSVFSNSGRSPWSRSLMHVEASRSDDPQHQVFSRKQPIKSYLNFNVKPPSFPQDLERNVGNLRNQRVSVSHLPMPSGQARDVKTDHSEQNQGSFVQEPEQMNSLPSIPTTHGFMDSTWSGISSQVSNVDVTSPIKFHFPLTSELKKAFSKEFVNEIMSRNVNSKRFPSGFRNLQALFSNLQKRGPPQTSIQPTKLQKRPASGNRELGNRVHNLFKPALTSKRSGSTLRGVSQRNKSNTEKLLTEKAPNVLPQFIKTYIIQHRNGYMRGKVYLSKTHYIPEQHVEVKTAEH